MTVFRFLGCAAALVGWLASPLAAQADGDVLKVGVIGTVSDAPFFIAEKKGYFRDEGLSVDFTFFDSAAKMIAPLGIGELDIGGGATSAALYNAAGRAVNIRIVADKARNSKGFGFQSLVVRKDLQDKIKSFVDLKGRKVAISAAGNSEVHGTGDGFFGKFGAVGGNQNSGVHSVSFQGVRQL